MDSKDLKKELAESQEYLNDHGEVNDIRLDIALAINKIRIKCGLTQKELAKKMKTKQAAISRAESGNYLPGLSFLERMAKALGTELIAPKFAFLENKPKKNQGISFCRSEPILVKDKIKRYKNTRPKSRPRQN
jgi:ribosome-binding protein aMBF1 (putative translation factor)